MTVSSATSMGQTNPAKARPRMHGRWLHVACATWIVAVLLAVWLSIAGVPGFFAQLQTPCAGPACHRPQLSPALAQALQAHGLSLRFYAIFTIALNAGSMLGFCIIGALLVWRKAEEPMALFGAIMLVTVAASFSDTIGALGTTSHAWRWPVTVMAFLGSCSLFAFFYLFPDGRFVPRWTAAALPAWLVWNAAGYLSPLNWPLHVNTRSPFFTAGALLFFVSVIVAQLHRYRRVSTPVQRQQTKWVVCGFTTAFVAFFVSVFVIVPQVVTPDSHAIVARMVIYTSFPIFQLLIPLSLALAILRYRLWDIDLLINRALVYGALTACVVALYVLVVGALGALFRTAGNLAASLAATGVVAVLFQPLRDRLQRGVNRLLYGDRDDPYAALARLGQRLEATLAPEAVMPTIVETVREALKLPYAAIALGQPDALVATSGTPVDAPLHLPLVHQGEPIGALLLGPRAPGEPFSPADKRLLADLARQVGVAVHAALLHTAAVRLTADLQRSRERLVTAREEERRRLRRDLHDGLGPRLAGLTLRLETARDRLAEDPVAASLLTDLTVRTREAVADIRRLVYALRPAALDDLGLVSAVREAAGQLGFPGDGGPQIVVDAPHDLPPLPAAVEVAAYRIAQEALTNVVRHARARHCTVRLAYDAVSTCAARRSVR